MQPCDNKTTQNSTAQMVEFMKLLSSSIQATSPEVNSRTQTPCPQFQMADLIGSMLNQTMSRSNIPKQEQETPCSPPVNVSDNVIIVPNEEKSQTVPVVAHTVQVPNPVPRKQYATEARPLEVINVFSDVKVIDGKTTEIKLTRSGSNYTFVRSKDGTKEENISFEASENASISDLFDLIKKAKEQKDSDKKIIDMLFTL